MPRSAVGLFGVPLLNESELYADVHVFIDGHADRRLRRGRVHAQRGRDFGSRLITAVEQLSAAGYERLIIVGTDCPQLTPHDIAGAIALLDSYRLVLGPDHRGGCWLIALRAADCGMLKDIAWQQNTDAAQLCSLLAPSEVALLETKFDLDSFEDLKLLAQLDGRFRRFVPMSIGASLEGPPLSSARSNQRRRWQLPPPIAA